MQLGDIYCQWKMFPCDYEGSVSTLCAGCGHDSISGAIMQAARCPALLRIRFLAAARR
jgi:hypothetical protein